MLIINMICDVHHHERRDTQLQSAQFDSETETFGGLLDAYRGAGWRIDTKLVDGKTRVTSTLCPEHAEHAK